MKMLDSDSSIKRFYLTKEPRGLLLLDFSVGEASKTIFSITIYAWRRKWLLIPCMLTKSSVTIQSS